MEVTESPKPPQKAPTYARDPISSSQNRLGGKRPKETPMDRIPMGGPKGRIPKERTKETTSMETTKEKIPKRERERERNVPRR